jgi:hypothetical protein
VLIGAGRLTTVTTEAVALAAGGNRRVIGVYAFMQTLLAVSGFRHCNGFARLAIPQPARLAGVTDGQHDRQSGTGWSMCASRSATVNLCARSAPGAARRDADRDGAFRFGKIHASCLSRRFLDPVFTASGRVMSTVWT